MAHTMSLQDRVNSLGRVASIQPSADILRLFPPKVLTCPSDMPVMQHAETLPESFSSNMFDPSIGDQMMTLNVSETTFDWATAIEGLGDGLFVSDSYDPQWMPSSLEDASHSPSQESSSGTEYTPPLGENDIVCFGMLHNVDVKLVGKMQVMYSRLNNSEAVYERFSIKSEDAHVVLRFHDGDEQFGYLRTAVAATLSPLLAKPHLEFEPVALTSELLRIIGHASKPADAIVKVDINVYGPSSAGTEVGDALSDGKLWLQKPGHVRAGLAYDNPHFLRIETNGARPQPAEPVRQLTSNGATSRRNREERLRKMVEEVYSSLNRNRQYDAADAGDRVSQKLLRHQEEALGFMLERESGHINERYCLWESVKLEDGREGFRHRITRAKIRNGIRPNERGGGILADEMGMGKSLSILALVMRMLDDGRAWAQEQENNPRVEGAIKRSRSTLVIVPSALLVNNWLKEIRLHLRDGVTKIRYHGIDRPRELDTIADSDIVVTTYSTLTSEFQTKSTPSLLHSIDWYRIVLDEAHIIRRRATAFYRACDELHANSRWCLTGTPIQNKLADIGTLFAFIRAEPFCKASAFRKWIELPFDQRGDDLNLVKERLIMLIEAFCLRRTRDIIDLPELQQRVRVLTFSAEERKQYVDTEQILLRKHRHRVGEYKESTKFGQFQVNLQMRLLCNHGTYQQPFSWHRRSYTYRDECEAIDSATIGQSSEITCVGCRLPMPVLGSSRMGNGFYEQCAHVVCSECIEQSHTRSEVGEAQHCPVCIRWLRHAMVESGGTANDDSLQKDATKKKKKDDDAYYFSNEGHSTKMEAIIQDVKVDLDKTKSIIFSCWTRTLQLLSKYLNQHHISYVLIDGSCSLTERQTRLDLFADDKETPVLIMTTGTGGFGLNLTCANRIFIVELQWNPGVESQAIARAIRLGQKNKVEVTRYMIDDTVEKEMRSQQQWKKQLASLGFDEMTNESDAEMFIE
ncbi:SNF2 family N-terminal domain-containing protein [Trichoderma longibrachiatum]